MPLLLRVPDATPSAKRCSIPGSLLDVYPTLIDLCGLSPDPNQSGNGAPLNGYSLAGLIQDPSGQSWEGPQAAISSADTPVEALEIGQPGTLERQHHTLRAPRWRYSFCRDGDEELYDCQEDPNEWRNLADRPEMQSVKRQLREQLSARIGLDKETE